MEITLKVYKNYTDQCKYISSMEITPFINMNIMKFA